LLIVLARRPRPDVSGAKPEKRVPPERKAGGSGPSPPQPTLRFSPATESPLVSLSPHILLSQNRRSIVLPENVPLVNSGPSPPILLLSVITFPASTTTSTFTKFNVQIRKGGVFSAFAFGYPSPLGRGPGIRSSIGNLRDRSPTGAMPGESPFLTKRQLWSQQKTACACCLFFFFAFVLCRISFPAGSFSRPKIPPAARTLDASVRPQVAGLRCISSKRAGCGGQIPAARLGRPFLASTAAPLLDAGRRGLWGPRGAFPPAKPAVKRRLRRGKRTHGRARQRFRIAINLPFRFQLLLFSFSSSSLLQAQRSSCPHGSWNQGLTMSISVSNNPSVRYLASVWLLPVLSCPSPARRRPYWRRWAAGAGPRGAWPRGNRMEERKAG